MSKQYTIHTPDDQQSLHIFHIDFDIDDSGSMVQMESKFYNELFNDIPDFAFGKHQVNKRLASGNGIIPIVREAMQKIYSIPEIKEASSYYTGNIDIEDKYIKRGEFGELILYHLLHEYFGADALISKIYFKDSLSLAPHGFDAVHVDTERKNLWLGESKLYKDGSRAIYELIKDLNGHFKTDFFHSEFTIISNRVQDDDGEDNEFIKELINPETKCLDKLANIKIALFAGYSSDCINSCSDPDNAFLDELKAESQKMLDSLSKGKENHPWKNHLDIYLFLLPLKNKTDFVKSLHLKLMGGQYI
ncbi:DUF1837 domain-containing protein [Enterococcus plantarum]|uniref:HamA C-terminal domain-containing protein n=1 Tax=Enterococcus plantarum TaxID=1077675 RepID=UPI001A8F2D47|nr:DUF1837 domain-containing protein [Enterococcus plantarum]MBO0468001.1 DUF1837 domain-containing protein [Enterococcus plantarum]